jgi:peroxiredoxin
MTIAVGDRVPANVTLFEYIEPAEGCSAGPKPVAVTEETAGRTIALFGLPGEKPPFTLCCRRSSHRDTLKYISFFVSLGL